MAQQIILTQPVGDEDQILVDNGDWRTIIDEIEHGTTFDGGWIAACNLMIVADNAAQLAERINSTMVELTRKGWRIDAWFGAEPEEGEPGNTFSWRPRDSVIDTKTAVQHVATYAAAPEGKVIRFLMQAETRIGSPGGGGRIVLENVPDEAIESFQGTEIVDASGRTIGYRVSGVMLSTTDDEGEELDARAALDAALPDLYEDWLHTNNDGSWNTTSRMVVSEEVVVDPDQTKTRVEYSIRSELRAFSMDSRVRTADLTVHEEAASEWPDGEERPTTITVSGSITLAGSATEGSSMGGIWRSSLRANVRSLATGQTSLSVNQIIQEAASYDVNSNSIIVSCVYQTNSTVISQEVMHHVEFQYMETVAIDSEGNAHIQASAGSPEVHHNLVIVRVASTTITSEEARQRMPNPYISGRKLQYVHARGGEPQVKNTASGQRYTQRFEFYARELKLQDTPPPPITFGGRT